jgi:hypothetical protein
MRENYNLRQSFAYQPSDGFEQIDVEIQGVRPSHPGQFSIRWSNSMSARLDAHRVVGWLDTSTGSIRIDLGEFSAKKEDL